MQVNLDRTDLRILEAIQEDGKLSNLELAEKIGLSPSPCARRVKLLTESGILDKTVTLLNPKLLGLDYKLFCITMDYTTITNATAADPAVQRFVPNYHGNF